MTKKQVEITKELGEIIKISYDLQQVNYNANNNLYGLIKIAESMYSDQIEKVADEITSGNYRFILVAGPSCAGKTTSSLRIKKALAQRGFNTKIVSLDDFLIDREKTPKLPDGSYDFENVTTVDIPEFKRFLKSIIATGKANLPHYDFLVDKRTGFSRFTLGENEKIIIEGLHALNPIITKSIASKNFYRVFVSVTSNFVIGKDVVIDNRQLRYMRRMLRDYYKRGTSIKESAETWKNVCKGEDDFITDFKTTVNCILNTTHMYEPLLYDTYLSPLIKTTTDIPAVDEIKKIFEKTGKLHKEVVPKSSLIWEFLPKN